VPVAKDLIAQSLMGIGLLDVETTVRTLRHMSHNFLPEAAVPRKERNTEMTGYNYETFSTDDYEFDDIAAPEVGDKAPDIELTTSTGEPKRLLDFDTDFLVLEMGSITCPLFQSRRGIMDTLEIEFDQVTCVVLYVREAHPGAQIKAHKDFDDKQSCATRLKQDDKETRLILVDSFEGATHIEPMAQCPTRFSSSTAMALSYSAPNGTIQRRCEMRSGL
jgi:hypothetical protein